MFVNFINENLVRTEPFVKIPATEIYKRYLKYCEFNCLTPLTKTVFNRKLVANGMIKGRGSGNIVAFEGVYLLKCPYSS